MIKDTVFVKMKNTFDDFLFQVLGFNNEITISDRTDSTDEFITLLIKIRNQARVNKNFQLSDQIRDDLMELGVQLNDDKEDSSYKFL